MSNMDRIISRRISGVCINIDKSEKDLNSYSDLNNQYHIVKSEDFKVNKLSQDFGSESDQNGLKYGGNYQQDISSDNGDSCSQSKKYQWKYRCPNCYGSCTKNKKRAYYCKECINGGNFYHSSGKNPERYADKRLRDKQLRMQIANLEQKISSGSDSPKWLKREILISEIEEHREKNKMIRKVIDQKKMETRKANIEQMDIVNKMGVFKKTISKLKRKNENLGENVRRYSERIPGKQEVIAIYAKQYQTLAKEHIKELTTVIFPIAKVNPEESYEDSERDEMVKGLADASGTNYVEGKWVKENSSQFSDYSILSAVLPGSGNYASNITAEDGSDGGAKEDINGIFAGLSFLTQLVNVVACYVNVHLPKRVSQSDFSTFNIVGKEDKKFQKLVSRLNVNVLYLCLSQGVSPSSLHPSTAVPNLISLLTGKINLGRFGPFEFPEKFIKHLEDKEQPDLLADSDSDGEWESVNAAAIPDGGLVSSTHRQSPFDEMFGQRLVASAANSVMSYLFSSPNK